MQKSNSLVYKTSKSFNDTDIYVTIRLDDKCKNGHQDFSITCDIYEKGKPKIDRYLIMCGCCHDEILKAFPEFKQFIDLHLCSYDGAQIHATANGMYHMKNGFNNVPTSSELFADKFCEYYNIPKSIFGELSNCENETQYYMVLDKHNVFELWLNKATLAIRELERLTDMEFVCDSVRSNLVVPTKERINEELAKIESGYYSEEQKTARATKQKDALITEIMESYAKETSSLHKKAQVEIELIKLSDKDELKKCAIYYKHNGELHFNWNSTKLDSTYIQQRIKDSELINSLKVVIL